MGAASGLSQTMVLGANASSSTIAAATTFQTMQIGAISAGLTSAASTIAVGAINGRVDGKALVQNVLMSATTGGITAGVTKAAGLWDLNKLKGMDRAVGIVQKVGIGSAVDATVDMLVYDKTQRDVLGRGVLKAGLGVAQLGVGDLGVGHGMGGQLVDGGLAKTALHATVGGVFAEMNGSRFEHGALSGAMAEQMSTHFVSVNDPTASAKVGLATSAVTMFAGGNVHDMGVASNVASSQHEHNFLMIPGAIALEALTAAEVTMLAGAAVGTAAVISANMSEDGLGSTQIFTSDKSGKSGPSDKSGYNSSDKGGGGNNKTPGGNNLGKAGASGAAEKFRQKAGKSGSLSKAQTKKQQKEQPWNIRPGQEWKQNVVGKAQKTGNDPGHQVRSYRDAITRAKQGEEVYLNRGMNRITGSKPGTHKPNYRPDVGSVRVDGKIDLREVRSKTDNPDILMKRMKDFHSKIPEVQEGTRKVIEITRGKP